jgi:hypothetical protein
MWVFLFTMTLVSATCLESTAFEAAGAEFQVNTYTSCNQVDPVVTPLGDGGFVVVWASGSEAYPQDGSISGIFGQRYDSAGAVAGSEFQLNQFTQNEQARPGIAPRSGGGFVVVWHSWLQDGSGYGVYARRYRPTGAVQGGEFLVNTYTPGWQEVPVVAETADGFVVVWQSYDQDGDREGVYAQRFDDDGVKVGGEFRVSTFTRGSQERASVASAPDGRFAVTWMSGFNDDVEQDGDGGGIFAQRYAANGNPAGAEFRVNNVTTGDQARPVVAMASDGGFLVVWESKNVEGASTTASDGIAARRFDASGNALGGQFLVNTYTTGPQENATVTIAPNGEYLVAWESAGAAPGEDTSDRGVFARRLDGNGAPIGGQFQVNTHTPDEQGDVALTGRADSGFVAVWQSQYQDGALAGVFGQRFANALCGDGSGDGNVSATDALVMLSVSVGAAQCDLCVCDVNNSGSVTATYALLVLQAAVGGGTGLSCPAC